MHLQKSTKLPGLHQLEHLRRAANVVSVDEDLRDSFLPGGHRQPVNHLLVALDADFFVSKVVHLQRLFRLAARWAGFGRVHDDAGAGFHVGIVPHLSMTKMSHFALRPTKNTNQGLI